MQITRLPPGKNMSWIIQIKDQSALKDLDHELYLRVER